LVKQYDRQTDGQITDGQTFQSAFKGVQVCMLCLHLNRLHPTKELQMGNSPYLFTYLLTYLLTYFSTLAQISV